MQVIDSDLLLPVVGNVYREGDGGQHHVISLEMQHDCLMAVIEIGLSCTTDSPDGRITTRHALHKLKQAKLTLLKHTN